jgi:predicted CxxxxCH...CXXCH cytochrome family protein
MIKCIIKTLVIALVLYIPSLALALPGAHDPSSGNGYTCQSCHSGGGTVGNLDSGITGYSTNMCFRCHSAGGSIGVKSKFKFETLDYANPFDTTTLPKRDNPYQTSHKWFGPSSSAKVKAAGAVEPVDTAANGLNKARFGGTLFCARCHNVHATSGPQSNDRPYLRFPNDSDQMCLNCHNPRNTADHTQGTHPVNVVYSSAYKANNATYRPTPLVNAANPTAQVKLVNGKVVCSTCHGVHNADSRSSTFDPYSTNQSFSTLSTSQGYLLRVDARGKAVASGATDNYNICTNCHTAKVNHNAGSQNIQCNDCHGGHVEYDAANPSELKNVYLIRRFNTYSADTGGFNKKRVLFRYTAASKREYYNYPAKTGVCQNCHNLTSGHFVGGTEANGLQRSSNCASCHKHNDTAGSFRSSGCDGCHGMPPVNLATTAAAKNTPSYNGNEATAPHAIHASGGAGQYSFGCEQCHNGSVGTGANHYTDPSTFQSVFISKVPVSPGGVITGGAPVYTPGSTQCSAVYCHSDGTSTTALGSPKTVTWANGHVANPMTCNSCHATIPATGAHVYHVTTIASKSYGCVTCHADTVSNNTTVNISGGKHVNALKDVKFTDTGLPAGLATKISGTSCNSVYCHSNGKGVYSNPAWTAGSPTGQCNSCHGTATSAPVLNTGTHSAHITALVSGTTNTSCQGCHTYTSEITATHIDGGFNVNYGTTGCAKTTGCHGTITPQAWGISTTNDSCTKCHGIPTANPVTSANRYLYAPMTSVASATDKGKVSGKAKTGAHETHLRFLNGFSNYSTVEYRCNSCHSGTFDSSGNKLLTITHSSGASTPAFSQLATKFGNASYTGGSAPTFGGGNCTNTYCHNPAPASGGKLEAGTGVIPSWTNASYITDAGKTVANCERCHKVPGSTSFAWASTHGSMTTDTQPANDCKGCHGHEGDNSGVLGKRHMDGILYASGECDSCHGYPPMTATDLAARAGGWVNAKVDTAGGGGYHKLHTLSTIVKSDGFKPCLPCHPDESQGVHKNVSTTVSAANVNVFFATDTAYRLDGTRVKRYNKTASSGVYATNSCSNVSCHYRPSPDWKL